MEESILTITAPDDLIQAVMVAFAAEKGLDVDNATPEELEAQDAAEVSRPEERQEEKPAESTPGRKICPGSYLPLVVGLTGYQILRTRKDSKKKRQ